MAGTGSEREGAADGAAGKSPDDAGTASGPREASHASGPRAASHAAGPREASHASDPGDAVADMLAESLSSLGGPYRRAAEMLHELGAIDRAVYQAVASVPAPALDQAMRRLSRAADRSRLWFAVAGV